MDVASYVGAGALGGSIVAVLECANFLAKDKRIPLWWQLITLVCVSTMLRAYGWID